MVQIGPGSITQARVYTSSMARKLEAFTLDPLTKEKKRLQQKVKRVPAHVVRDVETELAAVVALAQSVGIAAFTKMVGDAYKTVEQSEDAVAIRRVGIGLEAELKKLTRTKK
jgi:hypothetical protein